MGYKVLVDELTVHKTIAKLPQPDGSVIYQNGLGQTYYRDEVIPDDDVAEDWREALESGEGALAESLSGKLEAGGEATDRKANAPFEGYDDMEEDDVLNAMRSLPSGTVARIQEYEAQRDEPRDRITGYNVGFGESAMDRQENKVGSDVQEGDENKAVRNLKTREVPEDGPVEAGEGITGTGDPQVAYGAAKAKEEGGSGGDVKGTGTRARRGRRDRQPKPPEGPTEPSLTRTNE